VLFRPQRGLDKNEQAIDRITRVEIPERGMIRSSALLDLMPVLDKPSARRAWQILSLPLSSLPPQARAEPVLLLGIPGDKGTPKVVTERAIALEVKKDRVVVALTREEALRVAPYLIGHARFLAMRQLRERSTDGGRNRAGKSTTSE